MGGSNASFKVKHSGQKTDNYFLQKEKKEEGNEHSTGQRKREAYQCRVWHKTFLDTKFKLYHISYMEKMVFKTLLLQPTYEYIPLLLLWIALNI